MKKMPFTKMCGAGNDFIIIDNRRKIVPSRLQKTVIEICDRKRGIGADGVCFIEASRRAHFRMRIINSDGTEAAMCGNGLRCASFYAYTHKIAPALMRVETGAGIMRVRKLPSGHMEAQLTAPTDLFLNQRVVISGKKYVVHHINTGVPHIVLFYKQLDSIDVQSLGNTLRYHRAFAPAGTNVNFVMVNDAHRITVRTYERGVEGETLACGTGSTASALISFLVHQGAVGTDTPLIRPSTSLFPYTVGARASRPQKGRENPASTQHMRRQVDVITRGGDVLHVRFQYTEKGFTEVFLAGPNAIIAEGIWYYN